jgi:nucleotide-binding universal stress UspA family protein
MKHIIIPVDFSKQSEFALETAAIIAKKHGSKLHVLHMLELSNSLISHSDTDNKNKMMFMLALATKKFGPFLDKDYLEGIEVETIVKHYKVYDEVDAVAQEINADLIVMGSHGLTVIDGAFAGSNAEKMVRYSSTPVLVVKSAPTGFSLDNIVFATDLSSESVPAFAKATTLLSKLNSNMHTVFVNNPGNGFVSSKEFHEKVKEFLAAGGSDNVEFIASHTVKQGLYDYAQSINADCIALSTHARTGISRFFKSSISEDVANHSHLPVLSFKR